jgi:hypothetical protein
MANRTVFAGWANALDFYYGGPIPSACPPAIVLVSAPAAAGAGSVTVGSGAVTRTDGVIFWPLNTNAPVNVGLGTNQEKVTPSATSNPTLDTPGAAGFTATFANVHGQGDLVASATCGLQEAIDYMNGLGGGKVVVTSSWKNAGGTTAMISAAVFPSPTIVDIVDNRT